jgi:hypothetical protein
MSKSLPYLKVVFLVVINVELAVHLLLKEDLKLKMICEMSIKSSLLK